MKVYDLSGNSHSWNLTGHIPKPNETRPRSDLHLKARQLIKDMFPTDPLLEEIGLPGTRLLLDFFLPKRMTAVEVHGQQHFKFISYFHGTQAEFAKSKVRDKQKQEWCAINNIRLISLNFDETVDEWKNKILEK